MSATAASLSSSPAGIMLPAPVVRAGGSLVTYQTVKGPPSTGNITDVDVVNPVTVSVHGLPQQVMDDIETFKPQLELMRYVSKRTNANAWSRTMRNAGYVHPSHGPAPSGNGSHTHGGLQAGVAPATRGIRPTEWPVTNWGQVIDVTQGMTGHMNLRPIQFRVASAGVETTANVDLICPSGLGGSSRPGRRFPYGKFYRPGYYKFRWSVIDITDPRGQRITGPLSDTVSLTTEVFPFLPDVSWLDVLNGDYHATASLDPRLNAGRLRAWIGSVSRLPR